MHFILLEQFTTFPGSNSIIVNFQQGLGLQPFWVLVGSIWILVFMAQELYHFMVWELCDLQAHFFDHAVVLGMGVHHLVQVFVFSLNWPIFHLFGFLAPLDYQVNLSLNYLSTLYYVFQLGLEIFFASHSGHFEEFSQWLFSLLGDLLLYCLLWRDGLYPPFRFGCGGMWPLAKFNATTTMYLLGRRQSVLYFQVEF